MGVQFEQIRPVIEELASEEGIWPELIEEVAQVALDSPGDLSLFSVGVRSGALRAWVDWRIARAIGSRSWLCSRGIPKPWNAWCNSTRKGNIGQT